MRLKRLLPTLDPPLQQIVHRLDEIGVKSTDQVVHSSTERLFGLLRRSWSTSTSTPTETQEDAQGDGNGKLIRGYYERLLEICLEAEMGGKPLHAGELLDDDETADSKTVSGFGLESLDDLLQGFFDHYHQRHSGGVIEIAGTKGSGKTLLATHLTLQSLLLDPAANCLWVDTEASFDVERVREVLGRLRSSSSGIASAGSDEQQDQASEDQASARSQQASQEMEDTLERIELATEFDLAGVKQTLQAFRDRSPEEAGGEKKVIVIDSIGPILGPCLSGNAHGRAEMQAFLDGLRVWVEETGALCILINSTTPLTGPRQLNPHPSVFSTTTVKPSLGTGFTYTSDVTLLLQKTGEVFDSDENERRKGQGRSVVEVLKNRTGPASTWTVFQTDGIGIYDVSP